MLCEARGLEQLVIRAAICPCVSVDMFVEEVSHRDPSTGRQSQWTHLPTHTLHESTKHDRVDYCLDGLTIGRTSSICQVQKRCSTTKTQRLRLVPEGIRVKIWSS